jgi:hypothetical protein
MPGAAPDFSVVQKSQPPNPISARLQYNVLTPLTPCIAILHKYIYKTHSLAWNYIELIVMCQRALFYESLCGILGLINNKNILISLRITH